ncbi:MAG: hypothetical protein ACRCUH_13735 [Shewanella sp.]
MRSIMIALALFIAICGLGLLGGWLAGVQPFTTAAGLVYLFTVIPAFLLSEYVSAIIELERRFK